jgi:Domain of unknown function (DUF4157)
MIKRASRDAKPLPVKPARPGSAAPTSSPAAMLDLQRTIGNRAVGQLLSAHAPTVERMERVTGYDLSAVRIHEQSGVADAAGLHGLTLGTEVHLSSQLAREGSSHADHVLRHELAHVVQQGTGAAGDPARLEHDAERTAHASAGSHDPPALRTLATPGRPMAQAYDPRFHRRAAVHGLVGTGFSDQQIGQIYAANWERDLSQAHPILGNTILCWKAVKIAAYRHDAAAFAAASAELKHTMAELLDMVLGGGILNIAGGASDIAGAKSYGGYRFYHHFDNPTPASFTEHPDQPEGLTQAMATELRTRTGGLPQHLIDSREYVKAQLVEAARLFRGDLEAAPAMKTRDAFLAREQALKEKIAARTPYAWGKPVNDRQDPAGTLSSPLTAETSIQAANERQRHGLAEGASVAKERFTPAVADALGRAGHALEDFFSHSNFVELALGEPTPGMQGLDTGTFETNDSMHALSHKLRGLIDDANNNSLLLNAALSDGKLPEGALRIDLASETLPARSVSYAGGGIWYGAVGVARDIGRIKSGKDVTFREAESASSQLLARLGSVSDQLEDHTRNKAAPGSHTMIAKDQPGHDPGDPRSDRKTAKFWFAQSLSEQTDRLILGQMPAVLGASSMQEANARLEAIFTMLDRLIAAPSPDHPLWATVEAAVKSLRQK